MAAVAQEPARQYGFLCGQGDVNHVLGAEAGDAGCKRTRAGLVRLADVRGSGEPFVQSRHWHACACAMAKSSLRVLSIEQALRDG